MKRALGITAFAAVQLGFKDVGHEAAGKETGTKQCFEPGLLIKIDQGGIRAQAAASRDLVQDQPFITAIFDDAGGFGGVGHLRQKKSSGPEFRAKTFSQYFLVLPDLPANFRFRHKREQRMVGGSTGQVDASGPEQAVQAADQTIIAHIQPPLQKTTADIHGKLKSGMLFQSPHDPQITALGRLGNNLVLGIGRLV